MTERGRGALGRSADRLAIGPSAISWSEGRLLIDIDEYTVPFPRRLQGRIVVDMGPLFGTVFDLDAKGLHRWRPIAPCAEVSVQFVRPGLDWQGRAYVDMNEGSEPLEAGFSRWAWSREEHAGETRILYDVHPRTGPRRTLALSCRGDGALGAIEVDPVQPLPHTGWRVSRETLAPAGAPARVLRTLEDTPFYARSLLGRAQDGVERVAVHESVDLDRFGSRWVQVLLPFKMPRRAG